MDRIAQQLGFPIESGVDVRQTSYYGRDTWYYITYPAFGYCNIKRIFPSRRDNQAVVYSFNIAYTVVSRSSFWPIEEFHRFMDEAKKSDIDYDLIFSGPKPPFTSYMLDDLIAKGYTYKRICNFLTKRAIPIRFNQYSYCGSDASAFPVENGMGTPLCYARLYEYIEPPKKIKDAKAMYEFKGVIEQLGIEKCKELVKEYEHNQIVTH